MTEKLTGDRVVRREAFSLTFKAEPGHFILESGGQRLTLACQGAVSPECRVDFGAKWQRIGEREEDGSVIWTFEAPSSVWLRRALHVKITAEEVLFQLEVTGEGAIDRVTYFAGFDDALATEPLATFSHLSWARRDYTRSWSGSPLELQRIFNPQPNLYEEQELPPGCPQRITGRRQPSGSVLGRMEAIGKVPWLAIWIICVPGRFCRLLRRPHRPIGRGVPWFAGGDSRPPGPDKKPRASCRKDRQLRLVPAAMPHNPRMAKSPGFSTGTACPTAR